MSNNTPVPNNTENPKPDVVAGLDPPTDPCIIRPDIELLDFIANKGLMLLPDEKRAVNHAVAYIQHLETQVTQLQSDQNLSLTTLRAERDQLREAAEGKFTAGQKVEIFMTCEHVTIKERMQTLWILEEKEKGKHRVITEESLRAI